MTANDFPPHTPTVRDVPPAPVTLRRPMKRRRSLLEMMYRSVRVNQYLWLFVWGVLFGFGAAIGVMLLRRGGVW